jgi:hypothetical protein
MDVYVFQLSEPTGVVVIFDDAANKMPRPQVWRQLEHGGPSVIDGIIRDLDVEPLRAELHGLRTRNPTTTKRPVLRGLLSDRRLSARQPRPTFVYHEEFLTIRANDEFLRSRVEMAYACAALPQR